MIREWVHVALSANHATQLLKKILTITWKTKPCAFSVDLLLLF